MTLDQSKSEVIPPHFLMLLCESTKLCDSTRCININQAILSKEWLQSFELCFELFLFDDSSFHTVNADDIHPESV